MTYLYGASVKKIQGYIFESSKLREIAGASEIVEQICTQYFDDFAGTDKNKIDKVIGAAGNIRALIRDQEIIEHVMNGFPKFILENAPGVQIVQGVVQIQSESLTKNDTNRLEQVLKAQTPMVSPYPDWSVIRKSPRTGKPACKSLDGGLIDLGTLKKQDAVNSHWNNLERKFNSTSHFPYDTDQIAGCGNFVAVIHADGNSLGKTLMKLPDGDDYKEKWKNFSIALDKATCEAAQEAYRKTFGDIPADKAKFRPIIVGGDDLTVVCAAEFAIPFTRSYLKAFEQKTKADPRIKDLAGGLTACAGIGFIKKNFPFYYGVDLAEMMCAQTKKIAKKLPGSVVPSSLMFAMELGGFVDKSFEALHDRALKANNFDLVFGPYDTEAGSLPSIDALQSAVETVCKCTSLKTGCRRLLRELYISEDSAQRLAERIEQIAQEKNPRALAQLKENLGAMTNIHQQNYPLWNVLHMNEPQTNAKKTPLLDILTLSKFYATAKEEK